MRKPRIYAHENRRNAYIIFLFSLIAGGYLKEYNYNNYDVL
jgi:hypothetical protein